MYFTYAAAAEPLTGDRPDAIRQTADIVADASHLGNAQNARTIFVFVPDKFRILHDFCKFPAASECRNWVPNNLPEQMRIAVLSAVPGIGYVDLTSSMVDATKTGVLPYYTDDIHLSPDGHRIAAEAINNYLNSQR
jgi:lysophospholipase L1-like esterase